MNPSSAATVSRTPVRHANSYSFMSLAVPSVVGMLSLVIMYGWVVHSPVIVQYNTYFAPMQFNTAFCFLLCSAAFVLMYLHKPKASKTVSAISALFTLTTLLEYATGINPGIDTLFVTPFIDVNTVYVGRMALHTTFVFVLLSAGLFLCASDEQLNRRQALAIGLLGSICFALGTVPLLGYISGVEAAYNWGTPTRMTLQAAFSFVMLSAAMVLHAWNKSEKGSLWLPIPAGVAFVTIALSISAAVYNEETQRFDELLQSKANSFAEVTRGKLQELLQASTRMALRLQVQPDLPQSAWQVDAHNYIEGYPYLMAIEKLDRNLRVQWVEPAAGNEALIGQSLNNDEMRRKAIDRAIETRKPVLTEAVNLHQGGEGFLCFIPFFNGNKIGGMLVMVFRVDSFLNTIIQQYHFDSYYIVGYEHDKKIFSNIPENSQPDMRWSRKASFQYGYSNWMLDLVPSPDTLKSRGSFVYLGVLCFGLFTAMMITLCTYLVLRWRHSSEALEDSSQFNNAILSSATYMIIATDPSGVVALFNKEAEHALGYSAEEIVGKFTPALWHDKQEIVERAQALSTEVGTDIEPGFRVFTYKPDRDGFESTEWTFIRKDRSRFSGRLAATPLKNSDGVITGYLGMIENITERKKAEEERNNLVALIEESIDYIGMADLNGKLLYHNRSAKRMLGVPDDYDMSDMKISDMHPQWAATLILEEAIPATFETGTWQGETALLHRDGHEIPVLQNLALHRNAKGEPVCFSTIMRDITERKKAELALRVSEATFRSAIENASIGMALVEPGGRWLKVNTALCNLLGYDKSELLQTDFQSITYPEDLAIDMDYVRQVLADEIKTYQMEKRYYHKNGKIVWTQLSVSLVRDTDGKPSYFISQIQDITERKEIERMKSEFISVVSHELRTPLTSIRGSLGLIVGTMTKELPDKANKLIAIAHNNCERLILLINDILDIDKIASGQMRFDRKEESLAYIIEQAVENNQPYADKLGVFIAKGQVDPLIKIAVDAQRLQQVFSNLLSNAAKFSQAGDTIEVSAAQTGNYVRICVKDYGPGIAEEFRSRIFGKFSQADASATRVKGGSGLGLHISKQIMEHMNGHIGFDSEVGVGSTFWIELPVVTQRQYVPAQDGHDMVQHYSERDKDIPIVLHVEDDPDLSNMLATALYGKVDVIGATTINYAEKMLKLQSFDMVVIDVGMPDGSGLALLDKMGGISDPGIPVVILSADEVPKEVQKKVAATMVKSRMSETKIVEIILQLIKQQKMK